MGQSIPITNGILSLCNTDFICPVCEYLHTEDDWYPKVNKSQDGLIYMKCKGCKTKLGVTTDMRGDVVVWEKSTEEK